MLMPVHISAHATVFIGYCVRTNIAIMTQTNGLPSQAVTLLLHVPMDGCPWIPGSYASMAPASGCAAALCPLPDVAVRYTNKADTCITVTKGQVDGHARVAISGRCPLHYHFDHSRDLFNVRMFLSHAECGV